MTETNEWAGWQALLAGNLVNTDPNEPFTGFYRTRRIKDGPFVPVAYWRENGKLMCVIDGKVQSEERAIDQWIYCVRNPISHEAYIAVAERGENWPDLDETVANQINPPAPSHNNAPEDEAVILQEQIEAAAAGASAYSKIQDDETLAKAQSLRARLNELSRTADKSRETLKKPHMEAGKAIDAKWQPLVKMAKETADAIAKAMGAWETEKARRAREEHAKREAEIRRQQEEARKADEAGMPAPTPEPLPVTPEPVAAAPIKGAYGRAASVKVVKVAIMTDQDKVYAFMRERPEVKELLAKLAQRATDAGHDVPGVSIEEVRKVA